MAGFGNMHKSLFRTFGVDGTLIADNAMETPVVVIVNFGVDEIDEFNEVVGRIDKATFDIDSVNPKKGERLVIPAGKFSGQYLLARKIKTSAYVEVREIVRVQN